MTPAFVSAYMNVARIVKTHGRSGEVVVDAIDGLPSCLKPQMTVYLTPPALREPRSFLIREVKGETPALVSFEGIDDISSAEALVGRLVLVRRSDVPQASKKRTVRSCCGREVYDEHIGMLGTITEVLQLPAHDVWSITSKTYGEVLIPVVDEFVVSIPKDSDEPICVRVPNGTIET